MKYQPTSATYFVISFSNSVFRDHYFFLFITCNSAFPNTPISHQCPYILHCLWDGSYSLQFGVTFHDEEAPQKDPCPSCTGNHSSQILQCFKHLPSSHQIVSLNQKLGLLLRLPFNAHRPINSPKTNLSTYSYHGPPTLPFVSPSPLPCSYEPVDAAGILGENETDI